MAVNFTSFTKSVNNIQALSDKPNETDGLTAQGLKERFDRAGVDIKDYINNTHLPELKTKMETTETSISTINTSVSTLTTDVRATERDITALTTSLNNLDSKVGQEDTYSSTETVIGTWFGKKLYRKCFSYSVYSGIKIPSDYDEIISLRCTIKSSQDSIWRTIPWNYQTDATWAASAYITTNGTINFYAGSNIDKFSKVNVIVEYTKTSD